MLKIDTIHLHLPAHLRRHTDLIAREAALGLSRLTPAHDAKLDRVAVPLVRLPSGTNGADAARTVADAVRSAVAEAIGRPDAGQEGGVS